MCVCVCVCASLGIVFFFFLSSVFVPYIRVQRETETERQTDRQTRQIVPYLCTYSVSSNILRSSTVKEKTRQTRNNIFIQILWE